MSNIIQNLEAEHDKILAFIDTFENDLMNFMNTDEFHLEVYTNAISFVRVFADKQHHQREEQILFRYMIEHGGAAAEKLVRHGMLVEHDQARYYIKQLEDAINRYQNDKTLIDKLTILTYGKAYCDLLRNHIDKENKVVYPFAKKTLSEQLFTQIEIEDKLYQASLNNK